MNLGERNAAALRFFLIDAAGENRRRALETRMMQEQPSQFCACVTGHPDDCSLYAFAHDSTSSSIGDSTSAAAWSAQMTSTVSSPARVPTTSGQSSQSREAATGWAPPMHGADDDLVHGLAHTQAETFDHLGNRGGRIVFDCDGRAVSVPLGSE